MLTFVSYYYGTFTIDEVRAAYVGSAAYAVGLGDFDYTYIA
jgi:hypothetical protein